MALKSIFLGVCGETTEAVEVEAIQAAAFEAAEQPLAIEVAEKPLALEVAVLPEAAQEAIDAASDYFAQFKKRSNVLG